MMMMMMILCTVHNIDFLYYMTELDSENKLNLFSSSCLKHIFQIQNNYLGILRNLVYHNYKNSYVKQYK